MPLAVALALTGVFCGAALLGQADLTGLWSLRHGAAPAPGGPMDRSPPTQITIASLDLRAPVVEVGWAADGSIAPPSVDAATSAGWFRHGATPGEPGMSVIVGHVDTDSRPAVFHGLSRLRPGNPIQVRRQDGQTATFTVESIETFPKTAFPAERIFAPTDRASLVLVTCGGAWVGGEIGYADNVIVFARLG